MSYYLISAGVISIATFLLAFFVLIQKTQDKNNQLFFLFLINVAIWSGCYFFWQLSETSQEALFWLRGLMIGAILAPAFYFDFLVSFIKKRTHYHFLIYSIYFFATLAVFFNFSPFFIVSVSPKLYFDFWPNPGFIFHIFLFIWGCIVLFQIYLMIQFWKKAKGILKQQLLYLVVGTSLGYIGSTMNYFLWYDIPIPPIGNGLVFAYVLIITYAIIRYRLFDIKIQFQKIFNFFFPIFLATLTTAGCGFFLIEFFGIERSLTFRITLLFFGIIIAQIFQWLFQKTAFRYLFFRKVYAYQMALRRLAEQAPTIVHLDELMQRILTVISEDMRVQQVGIVIVENIPLKKETIRAIGFEPKNLRVWATPSELLTAAFDHNNRLTFVTDEIAYELEANLSASCKAKILAAQDALLQSQGSVVVALKVQKSILGFLILGTRASGSYTAEDITLLEEVSRQLSVALMHSRIHEAKTTMTHVLRDDVARATGELQKKLSENEELSQVKSQFIEVASHQLRTPISVIRNSLEMIIQDYINPAKEKGMPADEVATTQMLLHNAFLASDNLNNTLSSILAAQEFIGAHPSAEIDTVKTATFFKQRMTRAQNLLAAKKEDDVVLSQEIDETVPATIVTDERKLGMMIDQLLMNAVLYTQHGTVTCKLWATESDLFVEIADTGIGVSAEEQKKLFQRFVRLKSAQAIVPDGTGLGLYLIRKYADLLRGHVILCSELGKGTIVRIRVPLIYQYVG